MMWFVAISPITIQIQRIGFPFPTRNQFEPRIIELILCSEVSMESLPAKQTRQSSSHVSKKVNKYVFWLAPELFQPDCSQAVDAGVVIFLFPISRSCWRQINPIVIVSMCPFLISVSWHIACVTCFSKSMQPPTAAQMLHVYLWCAGLRPFISPV